MFFDIFNLFLGFVWFLNSHTIPLNSQWVHRHTGTEGHRQRRESYLRSQEQERASTPGPEAVSGNTQPVPWGQGVVPAAVQVCFHDESGEDSNGSVKQATSVGPSHHLVDISWAEGLVPLGENGAECLVWVCVQSFCELLFWHVY